MFRVAKSATHKAGVLQHKRLEVNEEEEETQFRAHQGKENTAITPDLRADASGSPSVCTGKCSFLEEK